VTPSVAKMHVSCLCLPHKDLHYLVDSSPVVITYVRCVGLSVALVPTGDFGCVVSGQLSIDRTDVMGGTKEVMMKIVVGE